MAHNSRFRDRAQVLAVMLFIALALVLGGGGSPNPATETLVQLAALLLAFVGVIFGWLRVGRIDGRVFWIAALLLVLPIAQLIPLPPEIWRSLPGGAERLAGLTTIDADLSWQPLTIAQAQTWTSLLSLIPPLIAMLTVAALPADRRSAVLWPIVVIALLAALLGAVQLTAGTAAPRFYPQSHMDVITAFHANRNAAADAFLIGMLACAALAARHLRESAANRPRVVFVFLAIGVLLVALILTGSRAGIALLTVAGAGVWLTLRRAGVKPQLNRKAVMFGAGAAVLALGALLASGATRLSSVAARFNIAGDFRTELWADAWYALGTYWPFGAGLGTASSVLVASERLEVVDVTRPNRVHNDYLELMIEGGALALAVLAIAALIGARMLWTAWRERKLRRTEILFAGFTLAILAAHSILDYPLRTMSLAVLAGVAVGLMARPATGLRPDAEAAREEE